MTSFTFNVSLQDSVSMGLSILGRNLTEKESEVLAKTIGVAVSQMVARHFMALDAARHHPDAHTHFYGDAARAVLQPEAVQPYTGGVAVIIDHEGIVQRYFGGLILPKFAKQLAIPNWQDFPWLYGLRPRDKDVPDLVPLIRFREGRARVIALAFAADVEKVISKRGGGRAIVRAKPGEDAIFGAGGIAFWLVDRVYQQADETVLPTDEAILGAAQIAGTDYLDRLVDLTGMGSN